MYLIFGKSSSSTNSASAMVAATNTDTHADPIVDPHLVQKDAHVALKLKIGKLAAHNEEKLEAWNRQSQIDLVER
jgi:hypothetical protein